MLECVRENELDRCVCVCVFEREKEREREKRDETRSNIPRTTNQYF